MAGRISFGGEKKKAYIAIDLKVIDAETSEIIDTRTVEATETGGRHRVRVALGCLVQPGEKDWNKRHGYPFVFITDTKRVDPAAVAGPACVKAEPLPPPVPASVEPRPVYQALEPNDFDKLRAQLHQGVQAVSAPQLFPTPPELAARMVELANIEHGHSVLEPSAGTGRILRAIREATAGGAIQTAIEIDGRLCDRLRVVEAGAMVQQRDFLQCNDDLGHFDRVLMNPPFANGQDIAHIRHALQMLKPGGRLVAICANGPRQNEQLRPLVEQYGGTWEVLPAGTFKESGTGVNAAMLSLSV